MTVSKLTFKVRQVKEVDSKNLLYKVYTHIQEVSDTDNSSLIYAISKSGNLARNNIKIGTLTTEQEAASKYLKCIKYAFLMQTTVTDNTNVNPWSGPNITDFTYKRLVQPSDMKTVRPNYPDPMYSVPWSGTSGYVLVDDAVATPLYFKATPTVEFPVSTDPDADELIACFSSYKINPSLYVTPTKYFVSDTLLTQFNDLKDAEDFSTEILDNLRDMKIIYEQLLADNWSTMYDGSSYPGGWSTRTYQ